MPWAAARSRRISSDQSLESWKTASGFTMLERMPCGAPSSASTLASWASAALAAEYAAKSLPGDITFLVATNTSAPPIPWRISTRMASRATRKWPVEFTANERSQSASAMRSTGAEWAMPALETRMSRPPQASTVASKAARTDASLVTSMPSPSARPPPTALVTSSATAAARIRASTSVIATCAPSAASRCATARPMPEPPPVTSDDPPSQLLLRRRQRELVELERPVLDVEGVLGRQRDVAAEGGGVADHGDRVVIDVVDDAGRARVATGSEHAEPRHQHHARQRVEQLDAPRRDGCRRRRV